MFGQMNPTQNVPGARARTEKWHFHLQVLVKLFYSSPSVFKGYEFLDVYQLALTEAPRSNPIFSFRVVRALLLKRGSAGSSFTSGCPECPFSRMNTFVNTWRETLRLWILLSQWDLTRILKYVSWAQKFLLSLLFFLFPPLSGLSFVCIRCAH